LLELRLPGKMFLSEIRDRSGRVLLTLSEEMTALDDVDLTGAMLDHVAADGLMCMGTRFDNATFRDADLYWLIAFGASFRNAVMDGCAFRGATSRKQTSTGHR
jgi:uncharacterized protein YjbI with pentapeptide repeats